MAASEDSNHICFSITTNPMDLVECSFEKYTHENDKCKVWGDIKLLF